MLVCLYSPGITSGLILFNQTGVTMAKKDSSSLPAPTSSVKVLAIYAVEGFFDTVLSRQFRAGEQVIGWDEARARHYLARGLVREVHAVGPDEVK